MEAICRDPGRHMRRLISRLVLTALLCWLAVPGQLAAQQVGADGFYAEPFLVPEPGMHTAMIKRMDADAAGQFLVTGSDDKSVRVWSRESGRLLRTIRVPSGPGDVGKIFAVALSPDGNTIAAGGFTDPAGTHIYLFDRASGQQVGLIGGLPNVVNHLAFSPDGKRLVAGLGGANGVRLFATSTWQQVGADTDYSDDSYGLAFARDGRIATTSYDGKVRLYAPDLRRL
jgi:WD40 repeat protein